MQSIDFGLRKKKKLIKNKKIKIYRKKKSGCGRQFDDTGPFKSSRRHRAAAAATATVADGREVSAVSIKVLTVAVTQPGSRGYGAVPDDASRLSRGG